ncbi:type II toxin-antitoxin system VapC family toxin [Fodinicurvata halophila]|uniref:Ribonuclease VapC n=1 Tax=Fodinicurvata halophila TaxID=1419723 RepID=A0ABV8UPN2_9PROT
MICLDTNVVIAAINGRQPNVRMRLEEVMADGEVPVIPTVVLFELHYGILKSARADRNATLLSTFLTLGFESWSFEAEDAEEAGDIWATLEKAGTLIGPYDVLIAAQARLRDAVLVTANTSEFSRVPGLRLEDWSV